MVSIVFFWTLGEVLLWAGKGSNTPLSGHDWCGWLDERGESPGNKTKRQK